MNYNHDQRDMDRLIEQFPSNEIWPGTNCTPQHPTLIRDEQPHPKLYLAKRDNDFGYEEEISETISEQLKKMARKEKRSKQGKEGSHCGSNDYIIPTLTLLESQYFDHLTLLDQFHSRKRNHYHSSSTIETPDTKPLQEDH